ncbi:MAG: hypothetical protein JSW52_09635 [Candidatus Coatesbacteria bacterium]|nr:MAG: hypothetical protein JSW52_09635 [Candidatus Coatesbacteria bacterium]
MAKVLIITAVAALVFGTAFTGCTGADETEAATTELTNDEPVSEPAETEPDPNAESVEAWEGTTDESAGETEFLGIDAEALVEERCAFCHDVDLVYKASMSEAGWGDTIDRMIARGASLNEEERDAVIEYLAGL